MRLETYIVNSFTERLAEGNPAGVVLCEEPIPDEIRLKIAVDIGKSETAFVKQIEGDAYSIRWFSPKREMPICGHATLAAAKVLFAKTAREKITFVSAADALTVERRDDGSISMKFPIDAFDHIPTDDIYRDFFPGIGIEECIIGKKTKKVILIVPETIPLTGLEPDFHRMGRCGGVYSNGIGISRKSRYYDFETRYFNPWAGVNEDPITGSVHTVLARYWGERLGKDSMTAAQVSHRPGILELRRENESVYISGKARIVFEGKFEV